MGEGDDPDDRGIVGDIDQGYIAPFGSLVDQPRPSWSLSLCRALYALTIAEALASELKGTGRAIKTVTKWTGVRERTAST